MASIKGRNRNLKSAFKVETGRAPHGAWTLPFFDPPMSHFFLCWLSALDQSDLGWSMLSPISHKDSLFFSLRLLSCWRVPHIESFALCGVNALNRVPCQTFHIFSENFSFRAGSMTRKCRLDSILGRVRRLAIGFGA